MTKTQQKQIIRLATNILYARRNNNIKREQSIYDQLQSYLDKHNLSTDVGEWVEQTRQHLLKTDATAGLNGLI